MCIRSDASPVSDIVEVFYFRLGYMKVIEIAKNIKSHFQAPEKFGVLLFLILGAYRVLLIARVMYL